MSQRVTELKAMLYAATHERDEAFRECQRLYGDVGLFVPGTVAGRRLTEAQDVVGDL